MPIHDWTLVQAGTFHDFHCSWIIHLKEALNGGLLPDGFYALAEQHTGIGIADVLTLQSSGRSNGHSADPAGPLGGAVAGTKTRRPITLTPDAAKRAARRTLTVRHVSGHRVVAMIEIVSPANKDREKHVAEFVGKVADALAQDVNLLVVDLFPPGPHDPLGIHYAICGELRAHDDVPPPADKPLTLAAYAAGSQVVAELEPVAVDGVLPDMPLYLTGDAESGVAVPLEATYMTAYRGVPAFWRGVLEGREPRPA